MEIFFASSKFFIHFYYLARFLLQKNRGFHYFFIKYRLLKIFAIVRFNEPRHAEYDQVVFAKHI